MTPEKTVLLIELLQEAIDEGSRLPDGAWELVNQLTSWAAPELVIVSSNLRKVLLEYREDDTGKESKKLLRPEYRGKWSGWKGQHFCGGYLRPKESIEAACQRMAKEIGVPDIKVVGATFVRKWLDHPYAFPVSLGIVCKTPEIFPRRANLRFFGEDDIPEVGEFLHPAHHEFLASYFEQIARNPFPFIPVLEDQYSDWPTV